MERVKDQRPATTPEEFLERLRSHDPVDLTESVVEAVAGDLGIRKPGLLKG